MALWLTGMTTPDRSTFIVGKDRMDLLRAWAAKQNITMTEVVKRLIDAAHEDQASKNQQNAR